MTPRKRKLIPGEQRDDAYYDQIAADRRKLCEDAKAKKAAEKEARRKKPPDAELVIRLIREEHGLLSPVARRLGIPRMTLEDYVRARARVEAVMKECRETLLDKAEGKLNQLIDDGDFRAVALVLTMLGKGRGYAMPKGSPLQADVNNTLVIESVNVVAVPSGKYLSADDVGGVTIDAKPIEVIPNGSSVN